jgi:hypothetical protein
MNAAASSLLEAIKATFVGINVATYDYNSAYLGNDVIGDTGTNWNYIPSGKTSWYMYGSAGVGGWGTLCGVPNGSLAVLNLMNQNTQTLKDQILYYACQTDFPISLDALYAAYPTGWAFQPVPDGEVLAHTVANSPLCHVSVSKWAYAAGVNMSTPDYYGTAHKTDRCAKVAAGVASFTAELLNGVTSSLTTPPMTAYCMDCHTTGSDAPAYPAQQGKMDCMECHKPGTFHSKSVVIEDVLTTDGEGHAKDTFNGGDDIQVKVKFAVLGAGTCFVKTYDSYLKGPCGKKPLNKSGNVITGSYEWTWSGKLPTSGCAGKAGVIMNLAVYDYQGGKLLGGVSKTYLFTIV